MATHEKGEHPFDIFDITDDRSGALHTTAVKNTIVYVNETDGKDEIPSISSFHDPEGAVHYYLGKLHICRSANVALMTHNALTLRFPAVLVLKATKRKITAFCGFLPMVTRWNLR
jgi:hypothetical protein